MLPVGVADVADEYDLEALPMLPIKSNIFLNIRIYRI